MNQDNGRMLAKLAVSAGLFVALCGIAALLTTKDFDKTITIAQYYKQETAQAGGGVVGGMILKLLCPAIGTLGAYIVSIVLLIAGMVFITERSVLQPIGRGSRRVYDTAREDMARRREIHAEKAAEKAEERRRYRLDQKVSGVALEPLAGEIPDAAPAMAEEPQEQPEEQAVFIEADTPGGADVAKQTETEAFSPAGKTAPEPAVRHPIRITGIGFGRETEKEKEREKAPEREREKELPPPGGIPDSPMIPSPEDILIPPKVTRTLAELEALDSLHSHVFSLPRDRAVWNEEEALFDGGPALQEQWALEERAQEERALEEPILYTGFDRGEDPADDSEPADPLKPEEPDAGKIQEPPADTKRVVTANGKIMEVDIDPDDDPLTRKRLENRLARQEAAGTKEKESRPAPVRRETFPSDLQEGGIQPPEDLREWVEMTTKPVGVPPVGSGGPGSGASLSPAVSGRPAAAASGAMPAPPSHRPPKPYVRPPYNLMKAGGKERKSSDRELRETARKLESTLQNFGVGVTVTNISCGPSVTRYELQPEQGVRVSKIVGLTDDIKLNLAAADIRIEAPIPGKASVGIEVPNKENTTVFLRDVLESKEFTGHSSKLAFAVGRDISGEVVVTDLAKMPHLLIAGATGSGKSVCINTLIMSVLYKAKPEEVRLIMVDPKVVELSIYNGIPHLLIPVVTDPKKAAGALNWAVAEMTDRYRKFADRNVRDLKGYNEKIKAEANTNGETAQVLPQIVIIIDELADLMMVCPGDVEDAICRLAQMARAAGLHLVIATQRPSVNVITGVIKANVPSRIAFSVSSGVDSRTIIDMHGAEKLLGKGDMLFYPSGYQKPVRVQGAFVSDSEVGAVVDFLKENNDGQTFDSAVEARLSSMESGEGKAGGGGQGPERDEYFVEAGRFIIEKQKASIGMLQRMFKIGFNRAARIMDQLAEAGVVSEEAGTKAREILMDMGQYEQMLAEMGLS